MNNITSVFERAKKDGCDAFLFTDEINRRYLTGFAATDGALLVDKTGARLYLDMRYYEMALRKKKNDTLAEGVDVILSEAGLLTDILADVKENKIKKIAVDASRMTLAESERIKKKLGVKLVPLTGVCETLRMAKTANELDFIRMAQRITDETFSHILGFIKRGMTETEIAAEMEYFIRKKGGTLAFDTICVFGANSSLPHGVPGETVISGNGFLTMDFGAAYAGYCSDMTRTVYIGTPDEESKKVYETVLEAQKTALAGIKAGLTGKQIDAFARDVIENAGYNGLFGHSLGHSLGLEIHEEPRFSMVWDKPIPAGSVMSVEPGIYIPGEYGVRIEDIVLVTEDGCTDFTSSPKELICL